MLNASALNAAFSLPRPGDAAFAAARAGDRVSAALPCAAVAAAALGFAVEANFGQYSPGAIPPLVAALAASVAAVVFARRAVPAAIARVVLVAAVLSQVGLLLVHVPCATWPAEGGDRALFRFRGCVAAGALATLVATVTTGVASRVAGVLLVAAFAAAGTVVLRTVPQPGVDVCTFQRESADALLHGRNPYAITFADPYNGAAGFYGDAVMRDGRTTWGYPYPPLPLLAALPGHLLGDFRLSMLAAMTVAGALLLAARPGSRLAAPAVALMLLSPRGFFVLEAGWIEPVVIALLAGVVFLASRWRDAETRDQAADRRRGPGDESSTRASHARRWAGLAVAVGFFLASKQYLALAVPLLWLLPAFRHAQTRWKALFLTALVGAVALSPGVLSGDVDAFVRSVVTLQFHQPFRPDALTLLIPIGEQLGQTPPTWIAFAAAAGVTLLALIAAPRTPTGFALALAAVFFAFFALNKQAFCNYYQFVIAALCCGIAAQEREGESAR